VTALARPIIDPAPVPGELERLIREQARDRAENHARLRFAGGPLLECDIIPPNGHANGKAGLDILADPSCHDPAEACEAAERSTRLLTGPRKAGADGRRFSSRLCSWARRCPGGGPGPRPHGRKATHARFAGAGGKNRSRFVPAVWKAA
jgi:hypothetical protein